MEAASFVFESTLDHLPTLPFKGGDVDLVLFFGLRELIREELLSTLREGFPNAQLVGCSSAGELHDGHYRQNTVVVMAVSFEHSHCKTCHVPAAAFEAQASMGREIADRLAAPDLKGILFLGEGLESDVDPIVSTLSQCLAARGLPQLIFGGKAGDNVRFEQTVVVGDGKIHTEGVVAVGLYGNCLQLKASTCNVWPRFEQGLEITSSDANLIHEFNGRPAAEVYAEILGGPDEIALKDAGYHPLILLDDNGVPRYARTVFGHDKETGALLCAGNVSGTVQVGKLNQKSFLDGVHGVIHDITSIDPDFILWASCVGRRLALGSEVESEGDAIRKACPSSVPSIGCYCYGEIGFCPHLSDSVFLNHSFNGLALREI